MQRWVRSCALGAPVQLHRWNLPGDGGHAHEDVFEGLATGANVGQGQVPFGQPAGQCRDVGRRRIGLDPVLPGGDLVDRGDHGFAAYNAAKAGVINFTRTLGLDHGNENIRATAVCPGFIDTPLTAIPASIEAINDQWINNIALGRAGKAEEIAQLVVFLLSPAASYITGTEIVIDGGLGSSNNQPNIPGIFASM